MVRDCPLEGYRTLRLTLDRLRVDACLAEKRTTCRGTRVIPISRPRTVARVLPTSDGDSDVFMIDRDVFRVCEGNSEVLEQFWNELTRSGFPKLG
jgi:hypothetical protein